jgi:hypothetical protein
MKEIKDKKKIEVSKKLLGLKVVEEKLDRKPLTPTGHRRGCNCGGK